MMKCLHCASEYTPKQQYCSTKCRVYHSRNSNGFVTKERKAVTKPLQSSVTKALPVTIPIQSNESVTDDTIALQKKRIVTSPRIVNHVVDEFQSDDTVIAYE